MMDFQSQGDVVAVEKILKHDRQMVNIVSREGQSALYLGVSFPPVIQTLVWRLSS